MVDILIRDVDPTVHERLKAQAADAGQTLQAYLSDVLAHRADTVPLATLLREWADNPIDMTEGPAMAEVLAQARAEREGELVRRVASGDA